MAVYMPFLGTSVFLVVLMAHAVNLCYNTPCCLLCLAVKSSIDV